ncbi:uncharacterized protein BJ212DRAFT_1443612 [Suillus subaureus]|uniref:CxC2-like cysteine cluster KDZ transposase-associated domain-containing protein n=1 Tax=Suillus subaureus TaxID=48587 RepID=A0A9P7JIL8_9AGAM|nr:uncharacterized protein BJ212DRAFT_1443612 [Suillus subaureus]KAG1825473.1 hypothetical protein BJ212DRAFT_1443612 [Suillus subaureus]
MTRPTKKHQVHFEHFFQQPSATPPQQCVHEYTLTTRRTTLQTAYILHHNEVPLEGEMNELSAPKSQWPIYNFFNEVPLDMDMDVIAYDLPPAKCRRTAADNPLLAWLPEHQTFLDETIFLEGCGHKAICSLCHCGNSEKNYQCKDCFGPGMFCCACIVQQHTCLPLHRIELGHNPGHWCHNAHPSSGNNFVIIDISGIQEITLDFCGCESAQIHFKQLLQVHWYPTTTSDPQTAATFNVLEHYHLLSFELKVSAYEFYHSLARQSDNTGLSPIKDRYSAFMRMVHEWCHLWQLRHSGRGHDPTGANGTNSGELAVLCPACPHPGKNLPDGWESAPPSIQWLYALFIAIDANFCLKCKAVSSDDIDPGLNAGWAYFVEETKYKNYLSAWSGKKQEHSTCVSHNTVNMANTKSACGLVANGVGTVDCACHEFKLPTGVGDLQKGEKYLNMDYFVFSALIGFTVTALNISYDIACQWSKKLWTRMDSMLAHLHVLHDAMQIHYFIPKFHIGAHITTCQTMFSWNLARFVGRTDGEGPERGWANINWVASSTKEMGPGSRCDMLDDHFSNWNWKKVTMFGRTLKRKMEEAPKWKWEHCAALDELEATIQPGLLDEWRLEVEAWEEDNTKPNPFDSRVTSITQAGVRAQLIKLEAQELEVGNDCSLHADVSPSILISSGIELEDQQCIKLSLLTNTLQRWIDSWISIQEHYMPIVSVLHSSLNSTASASEAVLKPQHCHLYLPPSIDAHLHCDQWLLQHEWDLQHAQAHDALNEIHSHLCLCSHMYKFKDKNLHGQNLITCIEARKDTGVKKYKCACQALESLSGHLDKVGWEVSLQSLRSKDVRPMGDFVGGHTQGTGMISWIWLATGVHIEWCKARAHVAQWSEEVQLLLEEMRCMLVFFAVAG